MEEAPQNRCFEPSFQSALRNGTKLASNIASILEQRLSSHPDERLPEDLSKQARGLSAFQCTNTKTIAVLGDSGEGIITLIERLSVFVLTV